MHLVCPSVAVDIYYLNVPIFQGLLRAVGWRCCSILCPPSDRRNCSPSPSVPSTISWWPSTQRGVPSRRSVALWFRLIPSSVYCVLSYNEVPHLRTCSPHSLRNSLVVARRRRPPQPVRAVQVHAVSKNQEASYPSSFSTQTTTSQREQPNSTCVPSFATTTL